jgi:hypothetical protein
MHTATAVLMITLLLLMSYAHCNCSAAADVICILHTADSTHFITMPLLAMSSPSSAKQKMQQHSATTSTQLPQHVHAAAL